MEHEASRVTITPNESAELLGGKLEKHSSQNGSEFIGWIDNQFVFNAKSLQAVAQEIELQYDVELKLASAEIADWKFTGAFDRADDVRETLEIVANSMGLKFEQNAIGSYSLVIRPD